MSVRALVPAAQTSTDSSGNVGYSSGSWSGRGPLPALCADLLGRHPAVLAFLGEQSLPPGGRAHLTAAPNHWGSRLSSSR
ncbi:hypothetical protein ACFY1U_10455 [Streptomyces sp. NPDC001351]|uniref:hypothetical protein n=1 Tax=Streptomyces sp. NPDC001351 TaxID=3364564 RepID=UPI0036D08B5E